MLGERFEKLVHHLLLYFFPLPSIALSFILPTVFCAFMNATLLSSSFFVDHNVLEYACFKMAQDKDTLKYVLLLWKSSTAAFITKLQIAFFAQPSSASVLFVTAKYCQT